MRLRRSTVSGPGVRRVRRGKGFSYHQPDGSPLTDNQMLQRIKDLVIPPAWTHVWICPHPNGHIQAVGTDVAGRRQYLYHVQWLAAAAFVDADPPVNKTVVKRVESAVMKEVAEELGNTPAVARSSYVDPRVSQGYERGLTIAPAVRRAARTRHPGRRQEILEKGTTRLIRRIAKG